MTPSRPAPSALLPDLFQRYSLVADDPDMKALVDASPRAEVETVMDAYRREQPHSAAEIRDFVNRWLKLPVGTVSCGTTDRSASLMAHINGLWRSLVRRDTCACADISRIALPARYVVPGGRFRECYYWDTLFTVAGLRFHDRELCTEIVRNLAFLIDEFGFVPNGNRTYYLTRSQPPIFFATLAELQENQPAVAFAANLSHLRREHAFWMAGENGENGSGGHVVRMPGGEVLNRYWDDGDWPRDEAYRADIALANRARDRPTAEVLRDVRAACESGWDFSSRWFAECASMDSIMTTSIIPSDLNALLFGLETAIAVGAKEVGDQALTSEFRKRAALRSHAMNRYLWNERDGFFDDYDLSNRRRRSAATPACLFALFCGVATASQARRTAHFVEQMLLAPGGLLTSIRDTGEQWDAPNGWAPLQWIAVEGLERYGHSVLAHEIARRWLVLLNNVFEASGRLFEKYDVVGLSSGAGGEYPLQDGFGWTNGVAVALLHRYPDLTQTILGDATTACTGHDS